MNALPQACALTTYLELYLTRAWDLPSPLIKPLRRLLMCPLLAAIIDDMLDYQPGRT